MKLNLNKISCISVCISAFCHATVYHWGEYWPVFFTFSYLHALIRSLWNLQFSCLNSYSSVNFSLYSSWINSLNHLWKTSPESLHCTQFFLESPHNIYIFNLFSILLNRSKYFQTCKYHWSSMSTLGLLWKIWLKHLEYLSVIIKTNSVLEVHIDRVP